jgi:nicotinamidase-related amidase
VPLELTDILSGRAIDARVEGRLPVAALTMEFQRGVMGDLASFPELAQAATAQDIVANAARMLDALRTADVPIVHCTAQFRADRAGTFFNTPLHTTLLRRPEHLLEGTPATEVVPDLRAQPTDYVSARRHGVAPFTGTPLYATLEGLGARVLVVCGVSLNLGIPGLCVEAVNLGYQVVVATDAVVGVPIDYGESVLRTSVSLVAALHTVDEIVEAVSTLTR